MCTKKQLLFAFGVGLLALGPIEGLAGPITQIIESTGDGAGNAFGSPIGLGVDTSGNVYVTGFPSDNAFKTTSCGDGIIDTMFGEVCDDGNTQDCDGCRGDCSAVEGTCGDGTLDPVCEECDDGNNDFGDACSPKCMDQNPQPDFLVDQLSITQFRQRMIDLSRIPSFPGETTPSRHWSTAGNLIAVDYIKTELESYGYTNVTLDPYTFKGSERHNIYATKMGTVQPTQMYIVSGHMDSMNLADFTNAPGFDDDASGTALVLELARVFAKARTDISVRFCLWNNEETGLDGSAAYVANHSALQGTLDEPTWLGVIQHDMILYDHFPVPDADVEYQTQHDFGGQSSALANFVAGAMGRYGTIPAEVGHNMDLTDSVSFWDDAPAVSVRENQRLPEIEDGSNPHWHEPTDRLETFTSADIEFGFNLVKMTAGAVAELVNAEPDCNMNDITDADDITAGAPDVNGDGIPDACQDCDANGVLDPVEIGDGTAEDCNGNGAPDDCDIDGGASQDVNGDQIPDECQVPEPPALPTASEHQAKKHRYLSIDANNSMTDGAVIKVEVAEMRRCTFDPRRACLKDDDCRTACQNDLDQFCTTVQQCGGNPCMATGPCVDMAPYPPLSWIVQRPMQQPEGSGCKKPDCDPANPPDPPGNCCTDEDWVARLGATAPDPSVDWSDYDDDGVPNTLLHIADCGIVPYTTYKVFACGPFDLLDATICSDPLVVATQVMPFAAQRDYGDIVGTVDAQEEFTPPDGFVNVTDLQASLLTIQNYGTVTKPQTHPTWTDVHGLGTGIPPNYILNVADLTAVYVFGLTNGLPYVNTQGGLAPGDCP